LNNIYIHNVEPNTRYDIVVDGVIYAVDTSKRYSRDRGMYVNVRLSRLKKGWRTRTSMYNKDGSPVWSGQNASSFYIPQNGLCRSVQQKKELLKWTSDKKKINADWKAFALALKMRTTPLGNGGTEVIE